MYLYVRCHSLNAPQNKSHCHNLNHLRQFQCSNKVSLQKSDSPVLMSNIFLPFPQTSELGVTEHVEGDPCKFALWVGRTPTSDNKIVLKVKLTSPHPRLKPPLGFDRYWFSKAEACNHWGMNILKLNIAALKIPYSCVGFHHQGRPNVLENLYIGLTQFSLLINPLLPFFLYAHLSVTLFDCMSSFKVAQEAFCIHQVLFCLL